MIMEYNVIPFLLAILLVVVVLDVVIISVGFIVWFTARIIERYREYRKETKGK